MNVAKSLSHVQEIYIIRKIKSNILLMCPSSYMGFTQKRTEHLTNPWAVNFYFLQGFTSFSRGLYRDQHATIYTERFPCRLINSCKDFFLLLPEQAVNEENRFIERIMFF